MVLQYIYVAEALSTRRPGGALLIVSRTLNHTDGLKLASGRLRFEIEVQLHQRDGLSTALSWLASPRSLWNGIPWDRWLDVDEQ